MERAQGSKMVENLNTQLLLAQISFDKEDCESTQSNNVGRNTRGFNDKCKINKK